MQKVNIDEASTHLSELIEEAISGTEVVITKHEEPIVKLVPISQAKPKPVFGSAKGLITMSEFPVDLRQAHHCYPKSQVEIGITSHQSGKSTV